jgi:flagellar motility protein MotE (MotC chaperone)
MESIDLEPRYSSNEVSGRCIKCLAEEKLFSCMRELLKEENDTAELQKRYKVLYSFLESDELQKLCDETEKYLSEGKEVSIKITLETGKPKYELKLK